MAPVGDIVEMATGVRAAATNLGAGRPTWVRAAGPPQPTWVRAAKTASPE
jgi:hypothetical protein